jgi:hypothetical protein
MTELQDFKDSPEKKHEPCPECGNKWLNLVYVNQTLAGVYCLQCGATWQQNTFKGEDADLLVKSGIVEE